MVVLTEFEVEVRLGGWGEFLLMPHPAQWGAAWVFSASCSNFFAAGFLCGFLLEEADDAADV